MDDHGAWVSLFSGGKDSSWALYRALDRGLPVERLLTVHTDGDSYMYHVPETRLTGLAAEAVGVDHVEVEAGDLGAETATDAGAQGDRELEPLERALRGMDDLAGVTAGAVASEYQASRVEALCDRLGIDLFAPLWGVDPLDAGREMVDAGFDVRVLQVAAAGLDESWLGRRLDHDAFDDLAVLRDEYGVHPLGEGGEFETLVVDGPHMDRRIEVEYEREWDERAGRGRVRVTDATLA